MHFRPGAGGGQAQAKKLSTKLGFELHLPSLAPKVPKVRKSHSPMQDLRSSRSPGKTDCVSSTESAAQAPNLTKRPILIRCPTALNRTDRIVM